MGADEKHAATYHGREYTPTTDELRDLWVDYNLNPLPRSQGISLIETAQADFTRWLDQIRAEAKAEAWDECANHISDVDEFAPPRLAGELKRANPYKEQS